MAREPDTRAEPVGRRLRRLRREQGVSQRELSAPGISYAYISRIEAGTRQPSVKALRMLARKLGVSPEYLETGSELGGVQRRELRLAEQELRLRLDGQARSDEILALLDEAEREADPAAVVRARILLGFAASARSDQRETIEQLSRVIGSALVTPVSRPDVYATLGQAYALAGLAEQAVSLFEHALAELGRPGPRNRAAEVRYATYLSYALTDLGDSDRARAVLAEIWERVEDSEDPYTQVRLHWSLGRVALEEAEPLAAIDSFRRAIALLEATEDAIHLARAHIACAEAALGTAAELGSGQAHLEQAERLLHDVRQGGDLAVVRRLQGAYALRTGDPHAAVALSEQALSLSLTLPREHGRAWYGLAEARAAAGEPGADAAFGEAIAGLARHGSTREHADVLRAYGRHLRDSGREREALAVFEQAADVASSLPGEPPGSGR